MKGNREERIHLRIIKKLIELKYTELINEKFTKKKKKRLKFLKKKKKKKKKMLTIILL